MSMTCIIVDDEAAAGATLKEYIVETPGLVCIHIFQDAIEAKEYFSGDEIDADVIFLDWEMPGASGAELATAIAGKAMIVFSTAHADFAVESYEYGAIDFLLKPFTYDRFLKAIEKCRQYSAYPESRAGKDNSITIHDSREGKSVIVEKDTINSISAFGNYCKINLDNGNLLMPLQSLVSVYNLLKSDQFLRVHRSWVININQVKAFDRGYVTLKDNTEIKLGRVHKPAFKKWIHRHGLDSKRSG